MISRGISFLLWGGVLSSLVPLAHETLALVDDPCFSLLALVMIE